MPHHPASLPAAAVPRVAYQPLDVASALPEDTLAAIVYGAAIGEASDPRIVKVGLEPLHGARLAEVWRGSGVVQTGRADAIRYAADADFLFGVIELDERRHSGIASAAEAAYVAIREFSTRSAHPHLLRVWNHFDDINGGEGDAERYRQFCIGRAAGLADWQRENYPAATAVGRRDGDPTLQVYWLAGRNPGAVLENPRQVNPWDYPRAYGPSPPQFSRGVRVGRELILVSGTASIVGHESHHAQDLSAQLDESLANLSRVVSEELSPQSVLKIYLRDESQAALAEQTLQRRATLSPPCLMLAGDICRDDLLVEIECVHLARAAA